MSSFPEYVNFMKDLYFIPNQIKANEEKLINELWYYVAKQYAKNKNKHQSLAEILKECLMSIVVGTNKKLQKKYVVLAQNRNSLMKKETSRPVIIEKTKSVTSKNTGRHEQLLRYGEEYDLRLQRKIIAKRKAELLNYTFNPDVSKSAKTGKVLSRVSVNDKIRKKNLYSSKPVSCFTTEPKYSNREGLDEHHAKSLNNHGQQPKNSINGAKGASMYRSDNISIASNDQKVIN